MKYKDRKEYLKRYRERMRQLRVDLTIEQKEQLDKIAESKGISLADWVRQHIKEDYKEI